MNLITRNKIFIFCTTLALPLMLLNNIKSANAYQEDGIKERNINFNQNIAAQIQDAFLYSNNEVNALRENDNMLKGAKNIKRNKGQANKYNFRMSKPKYNVDLNTETRKKIAYNAYIDGQYEIAISIYKQLIEDQPFDDYSKYSLALTYQKLKQYKSAKEIYYNLLKKGVSNKEDVVANLVIILSEESPKEALFLLTKLSRQNPESGYFLAQKALVLERIGNHELAIKSMREATLKEPQRIDYKFNLAVIYDRSEKFSEALESYYEVMKSYQNDSSLAKNIPIDQVRLRIDEVRTFI